MNEEIKFRYIIRHKGKIKTIYATLDEIERGKMDDYLMQKSARFRGEDELLARDRYVGLNDKNKEEIYDGDIMKWDDSGDTLEVRWIDSSWQLFGSYNKIASHNWKDGTIIGNIYENPELLKTAKG